MPNAKVKGNMIGQRIQDMRREAGLTQIQLSAELDVSHGISLSEPLISKIEQGNRTVRDKELYAIAKALGVSPNDLFGWP